jgi:hypothetical protein
MLPPIVCWSLAIMRYLVVLAALCMPVVAWFSQQGSFGPTNGAISDRYPTLLVAAGYAFAIWGPIFVLDAVFAVWQWRASGRPGDALSRIRPLAIGGFLLTAVWMPIFSSQIFWLALLVIWASLACLLYCAIVLARDRSAPPVQTWLAWLPLSLHAGWLSLAAFLNTAQVIVAYRLLAIDRQLPWSAVLLAAAGLLLWWANARMRGNPAYLAAVVWGLAAVYIKQSRSELAGAPVAAWLAIAMAALLVLQTIGLRRGWARQRAGRG